MSSGRVPAEAMSGIEKKVMSPVGVIRPILPESGKPPESMNHRFPSGPAVTQDLGPGYGLVSASYQSEPDVPVRAASNPSHIGRANVARSDIAWRRERCEAAVHIHAPDHRRPPPLLHLRLSHPRLPLREGRRHVPLAIRHLHLRQRLGVHDVGLCDDAVEVQ
jgi:hypothetical protein